MSSSHVKCTISSRRRDSLLASRRRLYRCCGGGQRPIREQESCCKTQVSPPPSAPITPLQERRRRQRPPLQSHTIRATKAAVVAATGTHRIDLRRAHSVNHSPRRIRARIRAASSSGSTLFYLHFPPWPKTQRMENHFFGRHWRRRRTRRRPRFFPRKLRLSFRPRDAPFARWASDAGFDSDVLVLLRH